MDNWQIWIDTGGTFTDGLAMEPNGALWRVKVLSNGNLRGTILSEESPGKYHIAHRWPLHTPDLLTGYTLLVQGATDEQVRQVLSFDNRKNIITLDQPLNISYPAVVSITAGEEAPVLAARLLTQTPLRSPFPPLSLRLGTTKGTNALLEQKGAKVALLITEGFEDIPYIGTQQRPGLFDIAIPEPVLFHQQTIGVKERIDAAGRVITPLTATEIERVVAQITADAVAISLLHAYKNPYHEELLAEALRKQGFRFVSCGNALSPSIKLLARTQTAIVNACLSPVIHEYVQRIQEGIFGTVKPGSRFLMMSSAGSLQLAAHFHPKDSLLSGPAGGVVAAARLAAQMGFPKILTFDMGGTSTDAARYNGHFDFTYTTRVGQADILSPGLAIETVAAGGGSICSFDGDKLTVGPESAGASPGPACYGAGGPLTITDVNLLLGKLATDNISVPLSITAAENALQDLLAAIFQQTGQRPSRQEILDGLEQIANEKMAAAIRAISVRQGFDPKEYALLAFGGAGGLHACGIATLLGVKEIILPADAGLLSAWGMGLARIERMASRQVLLPVDALKPEEIAVEVFQEAVYIMQQEGIENIATTPVRVLMYLRFKGQETPLEVVYTPGMDIAQTFQELYEQQFGYLPQGLPLELESVKAFAGTLITPPSVLSPPEVQALQPSQAVVLWETLSPGFRAQGPLVLAGKQATAWLAPGWEMVVWPEGHVVFTRYHEANVQQQTFNEVVALELFTNRFSAIADAMGHQLQRTAFSVNVKERLDFSCALLDPHGYLLVNAPHIPVHLGSLGICARKCLAHIPIEAGDVIIVNHPKYGGSHLPDITLMQGVFTPQGQCVGYVINRAHHAEVGGKRPGSMPPDAQCLAEEGVVFTPTYLVKNGVPQWEEVADTFSAARWPTRALAENLADLRAALAALKTGEHALLAMVEKYGKPAVTAYMERLQVHAYETRNRRLAAFHGQTLYAEESLDDGHTIALRIKCEEDQLSIDFSGTAGVHPGNFNANISIVYSAVMYVLRLLAAEDLPLNEGLLRGVQIHLPENTFLHPNFVDDPLLCPAVVGGNTEVSQRLVDTLLKAFGVVAAGQGTMNNFLFGNNAFGYYETIGGGAGAGPGFHGRSGVHQHMTNTRITDPEDLERVYPVRLHRFAIRKNSGGVGKWKGGDGLVREVEALVPIDVTLLTQNRINAPFGGKGGGSGASGAQWLVEQDGTTTPLPGVTSLMLYPGQRIRIETPGGGGWECEDE
ncbi:MAG: hydantoinase B/oxoprolinase family protein [Saprospiraceae bacterium]